MSEVEWIKISTEIFTNDKIKLIESMKDSDAFVVIWFKILVLAGKQNNKGLLMLGKTPYTTSMLATVFNYKESLIKKALDIFEKFEMIEIIDGVIAVKNWGKYQNLEQLEARREYQKNYQREYRKKQKDKVDDNKSEEDKSLHKHLREDDVNNESKHLREDDVNNESKHLREDDVNPLEEDKEEDKEDIYSVCINNNINGSQKKVYETPLPTDTHTPIKISSKQINETCDLYESLCKQYGTAFVSERIRRARQYKNTDNMETVAKWCREDWQKKVRQGNGKVNNFNRFDSKSDYDMDELESKLLSN